ncbi:hypothetical protein RKE25_12435 [Dyella sp. BiH032]|uniref:terpene synthase family protein n=1 Tax=Dyella sp. BiH032 TaxID=3075430 RepID=UPI002892C44A|nr:hypothetical protein [Dyella sp. BiH032]WNL44235.1 hypothetical protein RKE25_12435 [Dyella sp. BiH032]
MNTRSDELTKAQQAPRWGAPFLAGANRPIVLPALSVPFPVRKNPHHATVRDRTRDWLVASRLIDDPQRLERMDDADFTGLSARAFPDACAEDLFLLDTFYLAYFIFDDQFDEAAGGHAQVRYKVQAALRLMRLQSADSGDAHGAAEWVLRQSWDALRQQMPISWQRRFLKHLAAYLRSLLRSPQSPVDLVAYLQTRRDNGGLETSFDCIELANRIVVPERFHASYLDRLLRQAANDAACLFNDIYSYDKERRCGKTDNAVAICAQLLNEDPACAMQFVGNLAMTRVDSFCQAKAHLPDALKTGRYTHVEQTAILRYVNGLECWMSGLLDWSRLSPRYRESPDGRGLGSNTTD